MFVVPAKLIPEIDRMACIEQNIDVKTLMKNAAHSVFLRMLPLIKKTDRIVILCGKGNNGGDGYALSLELHEAGYDVAVINAFSAVPKSEEAQHYYRLAEKNVKIFEGDDHFAARVVADADHIVEAVFGTGFSGTVPSPVDALFRVANSSSAIRHAVDIPGGIRADDGTFENVVFEADYTYTFAIGKVGLYSYPANRFAGKVTVEDIGISYRKIVEKFDLKTYVTDDEYFLNSLKKRSPEGNKGTFGRLCAFVGSRNMTGAASLALKGALRCGVGLAVLCSEERVTDTVRMKLDEPVYSPLPLAGGKYDTDAEEMLLNEFSRSSAALIGCGLGNTAEKRLISNLIRKAEIPLILDADALNALENEPSLLRNAKTMPIITPHPRELSRISGLSVEEIQDNRISTALAFAMSYHVIVVLKGAATVIAHPDGRVFLNPTGNDGLAKGGSGDVLSGMIASFAAQGYDRLTAAVLGVYLHGKAGDFLAEEISSNGFLPSEIPEAAARLFPKIS